MAEWSIIPYEGVGPLHLNASRREVRAILGTGFSSFRKYGNISLTDVYEQLGIHLYYDESDNLEFIEVFLPTTPTYEGIPLIGEGLEITLARLRGLGVHAPYAEEGYTFSSVGVSLWVPENEIKGVGIYRRGYYKAV